MVKHWGKIIWVMIICISCESYDFGGMLAAGSSVEQRFGEAMSEPLNQYYPREIEVADANYGFAVVTDMHVKSEDWDRVADFVASVVCERNLALMPLGDYMYIAGEPLGKLAHLMREGGALHVFPAIGNHEVYKNGYQDTYRQIFGPTCYFFKVRAGGVSDLFLVLDSANGTLGRKQMEWMQGVLSEERSSCRHCFVFTHANFFNPSGYLDFITTYPVEEQMKLLDIFAKNRVTTLFSGHSHHHDRTVVRSVEYITLDSWVDNRTYCAVRCLANGEVRLDYK